VEDDQLIRGLLKNDPTAFECLIDRYQDNVYNTCLGILKQPVDAEDITQEVFVEVFKSINTFRNDAKLSTWIYRIALNKSLEMTRKSKRLKRKNEVISIEKNYGSGLSIPSFDHPCVEMEMKESASILMNSVDRLPDAQRIAFVLKKIEGLSQKQIAEIMKVSESSVESLLARAKKNLKKRLNKLYRTDAI